MLKRLLFATFVIVVLLALLAVSSTPALAGNCVLDELSVSPGSPVTVGTNVVFHYRAHCDGGFRAQRLIINGSPWGESSELDHYATWHTADQFGAGDYTIYHQAAENGNDSWSGVTQSTPMNYTVNPAVQPPVNVSCSLSSMSPANNIVVEANTPVTISANGSCSPQGNRSMKVTVDDGHGTHDALEDPQANSISYIWPGAAPSNTLWIICVLVDGNGETDWSHKAMQCVTIQVQDQGHQVTGPIATPVTQGGNNDSSGGSGSGSGSGDSGGSSGGNQSGNGGSGGGENQNPPSSNGSLPTVGHADTGDACVYVVTGRLNVRSGPGVNYNAIAQSPAGSYLTLIGQDASGWYRVRTRVGEGFVANGSAYTQPCSNSATIALIGQTAVVPIAGNCGAAPATRLQIGGQGRSTYSGTDHLNLRSGPGQNNGIITYLHNGDVFSVTGGPTCSGNFQWWNVNYNGQSGWVAEGSASDGYFVEPYGSQQPTQPQQPVQSPSDGIQPNGGNTYPAYIGNPQVQPTETPVQPVQQNGSIVAGDQIVPIGTPATLPPEIQAIIGSDQSDPESSAQLSQSAIQYLLENGAYISSPEAAAGAQKIMEIASSCGVALFQLVGNLGEAWKYSAPPPLNVVASAASGALWLTAANDNAAKECLAATIVEPAIEKALGG
ncbi:MAG TPA: SH3 domain-containing protein [Patescibacteria group bacterium]|nr:SH3 domain-containing protein [Patescibacteria group bacterium]